MLLIAALFIVISRVIFLVVFLHLLARITTGNRTAGRGDRVAFALADRMPQQTARYGTHRHAGDLVVVFRRILHFHVMADSLRSTAALFLRRRCACVAKHQACCKTHRDRSTETAHEIAPLLVLTRVTVA